jgi:serine/threonine protein kinase
MTSVAYADVYPWPAPGDAHPSGTRRLAGSVDPNAPSSLSLLPKRFRLLEKLGQGGMGVVYRAVDCELGREVALKVLGAPRADDLYRLKREFRLLAEIRHPNVIRLHDLFVEDCKACFTMDLVIGTNLYDFVHRGGTCDYASLRTAAKQLASALAAVHAAGQLHRDVKPSNVMVTAAGRVVLFDFGLAAPVSRKTGRTKAAGVLLGTRGYIAPEQARGDALTVAADWYSFGVTLFEAATGRRPFDDAAKTRVDDRDVELGRVNHWLPDAPADLDDLVASLLDPVPRRRPDEAAVMKVLGGVPRAAAARSRPPHDAHAPEAIELARAFDRLERGQANVLRLYGRAAGRSAIVERFLEEREAQGTLVLRGRCRPRETVRYNALDEVIDSLSHALEHMPFAEVVSVLPPEATNLADLFPVLARLETATDGMLARRRDGAATHERARDALKNFLGRLARRRSVVIWIDDAQWADRESGALLRDLLCSGDAPPVLVLLGFRCRDDACAHAHDVLHDPNVEPRARCA